jgi:hypothetical protein
LARAYAETGNITKAKKTSLKVLKHDPFNQIAKRSLDKWKTLKKGQSFALPPSKADSFLEEPGKTKIITLLNLSNKSTIAKLDAGDQVNLNTHSHKVSVCTSDNKYIGKLPDDMSAHIKKMIKYGYQYSTLIKSVSQNDVKVFIRELKRPGNMEDIPSFSAEKVEYISFTPPDLVHNRKEINVKTFEEEDES